MNATLLPIAQSVIAAQPFSAMLGARVTAFDTGSARLELDIGPALRQQYGFVHGGVLAYLVDNALTFAGASVLGNGAIVTAEMKVNYLRPAAGDGRLVAEAVVVGSGRSQAVCRCDVYIETDGERKLVAAGQGTICRSEPTAAGRSLPCPTSSFASDAMTTIQRFHTGPRLSEATVHHGTAYLAGQVAADAKQDISGQTRQVLAAIDALLAEVGSDKSRILMAQIFIADMADFAGMNAVWEAWVAPGQAPCRATVEAPLAKPGWRVEIVVTAAVDG